MGAYISARQISITEVEVTTYNNGSGGGNSYGYVNIYDLSYSPNSPVIAYGLPAQTPYVRVVGGLQVPKPYRFSLFAWQGAVIDSVDVNMISNPPTPTPPPPTTPPPTTPPPTVTPPPPTYYTCTFTGCQPSYTCPAGNCYATSNCNNACTAAAACGTGKINLPGLGCQPVALVIGGGLVVIMLLSR